jgi:hypothetical protein
LNADKRPEIAERLHLVRGMIVPIGRANKFVRECLSMEVATGYDIPVLMPGAKKHGLHLLIDWKSGLSEPDGRGRKQLTYEDTSTSF